MTHAESGRSSDPVESAGAANLSPATMTKCGICGKRFDFARSSSRPFCSPRCQQIDLGNWLGESYGLPWEGESSSVEPGAPPDDRD